MLAQIEPTTIAAAAIALLLAIGAGWLLHRAVGRWRLRARFRRARAGEQRAIGLLEAAGFRVYGQQVQQTYAVSVDGEPCTATVRADLLASRGRRRYVVEVKTGRVARPSLASTRRQLLEYLLAFGVDGVMLADMERSRLYRVDFSLALGRPSRWAMAGALAVGILAGLLLASLARAF